MTRLLEWLLNLQPGRLAGGDWRIGFVADYNNYIRLGLFVLLGVLVWMTVRNYRREGEVRPRIKKLLAVVRITVIALVIAILFQPAVVLRVTETLYSSVLVLVDNSMSMRYADRYAAADQTETREALQRALPDEADLAETPRIDILRRQLGGPDSVLNRLAENHPVEIFRFSTSEPGRQAYTDVIGSIPLAGRLPAVPDAATSADAESPASTEDVAPETGEAGSPAIGNSASPFAAIDADGYETNLASAMRDALDRFQGRRIGALVVVSDGQPTQPGWAARLDAAREYAEQRGVPRLAVLVGDPTPPRNIAVVAVRAPREIRRNSETEVQVLLSHRNLGGEKADVAVYARKIEDSWPDDITKLSPLATESVTLTAGEDDNGQATRVSQTVALSFTPEELGEYVYRAVVKPRADELTDEDNTADAFVKVSDDKIRVLLVSGDAGWSTSTSATTSFASRTSTA